MIVQNNRDRVWFQHRMYEEDFKRISKEVNRLYPFKEGWFTFGEIKERVGFSETLFGRVCLELTCSPSGYNILSYSNRFHKYMKHYCRVKKGKGGRWLYEL